MRWLLLLLLLVPACTSDRISRELGAACNVTEDCAARCLQAPTWPGGFCSRDCLHDEDCPAEAACVADGGVCVFLCESATDCAFLGVHEGRGWECREADGTDGRRSLCLPEP